MSIKDRYKEPEFWVVVGFFLKTLGLDAYITPEQIQQTTQHVEQLTDHIGVVLTDGTTGDPLWMYMLATVYVAGRMGYKMLELKYGR